MATVLDLAEYVIYAAMAGAALVGLFFTILLSVRIAKKRFSDAAATPFFEEVSDMLQRKDF